MKIWITRFALTDGIVDLEVAGETEEAFVTKGRLYPKCWYKDMEGIDWCRTREAAVACAEEMRKKRIEQLERQLKKYKNMKFE